ncbi:hypothetical protein [Haloarchaeobius sp. DT45]|uniref:hypothetical protein n=1 Tax=Haloarchaeobius sp. DT45 TaxID=3446116 RepID=UPI003F6A7D6D
MVEIKLAAVVQFGFYSSKDSEVVEQALEEIYGESGDTYGGVIMGTGGSWGRTEYSKDDPESEELSPFSEITTYVEPDNRHVHDVVTVGRLSEDEIARLKEIDLKQAETVISGAIESVESFTSDVPTVPQGEGAKRPTVFYVEPTEELEFRREGIETDQTVEWLEENRDFLQRMNILLGQPISIVGTEDVLAPHSFGAGFIRRVTMLNASSTFDFEHESKIGPIWLRRIEDALKRYYRSDCWLNYRRTQIGEIDSQTHGTENLLAPNSSDLDSYQSAERDIEELRRNWVDVYTMVSDEVATLESDVPTGEELEIPPQQEIVIPPPASHSEEHHSLYKQYVDHIDHLRGLVQSDLDRVGKKLDRFSQFIHDSVNARATETNIQLQEDVKYLTRILTWLTVLLAGLGVAQFLLSVF